MEIHALLMRYDWKQKCQGGQILKSGYEPVFCMSKLAVGAKNFSPLQPLNTLAGHEG
jgi:hypothetical protein